MGRLLDEMTLTVTRRPGAWTNGVWTPAPAVVMYTFPITASRPQPVGPEVLEMLPEAARSTARYITVVPDGEPDVILVEDDAADKAADYISYNGRQHLVTSVENWDGFALGHRALVLLEVGKDG